MDFKLLVEELKAKGLTIAEDAAESVVEAVFSWLEKEVVKTENKLDDLLLVVLPMLKPLILAQVDKIDGDVSAEG